MKRRKNGGKDLDDPCFVHFDFISPSQISGKAV